MGASGPAMNRAATRAADIQRDLFMSCLLSSTHWRSCPPDCLMATLPHGNSRLQEFSPASSEATISEKNQPLQAACPPPESVLECRPRHPPLIGTQGGPT